MCFGELRSGCGRQTQSQCFEDQEACQTTYPAENHHTEGFVEASLWRLTGTDISSGGDIGERVCVRVFVFLCVHVYVCLFAYVFMQRLSLVHM